MNKENHVGMHGQSCREASAVVFAKLSLPYEDVHVLEFFDNSLERFIFCAVTIHSSDISSASLCFSKTFPLAYITF